MKLRKTSYEYNRVKTNDLEEFKKYVKDFNNQKIGTYFIEILEEKVFCYEEDYNRYYYITDIKNIEEVLKYTENGYITLYICFQNINKRINKISGSF